MGPRTNNDDIPAVIPSYPSIPSHFKYAVHRVESVLHNYTITQPVGRSWDACLLTTEPPAGWLATTTMRAGWHLPTYCIAVYTSSRLVWSVCLDGSQSLAHDHTQPSLCQPNACLVLPQLTSYFAACAILFYISFVPSSSQHLEYTPGRRPSDGRAGGLLNTLSKKLARSMACSTAHERLICSGGCQSLDRIWAKTA